MGGERDAGRGEDLRGRGDVGDAHLVGGERARLVAADEVDAAERLHRRQPLHHGAPARHPHHAEGQRHGDHDGEALQK